MSDEQQIFHYNPLVKYQAHSCPQTYAHLWKFTDSEIVPQHLPVNLAQ